MAKAKHAMEIFKYLEKSNCRECGEKTCLAFAGAVFQDRKKISQCPRLSPEIVSMYSDEKTASHKSMDEVREDFFEEMTKKLKDLKLPELAKKTGGHFDGKKLTIKILGKDFSVNTEGNFVSQIHVNPWIVGPFLDYVIYGKGTDPTGSWVSYRELIEGKERYPLFQKRCEQGMKRIADTYTDLFDDLVHIFGGQKVAEEFESDISVVLYPLPKVPIMVCYWRPEDGMESELNLFFDKSADVNFQNGSAFTLGAGLTQMFEKLATRHGIFEDV
jgi:hypothetical protein